MGVQTQIDRIKTEVETQTDLIEQIATALEGKAGGGVDTCSVTVQGCGYDEEYERLGVLAASILEDGVVSNYFNCNGAANSDISIAPITLQNVICGSTIIIFVRLYSNHAPFFENEGGVTVLNTYPANAGSNDYAGWIIALKAPTVAGVHSTVKFAYEP